MKHIAALFVRIDSIYKTIPDVDCYDIERNALTFPGGMPVVAHPPCRGWGRLRQFSNATEEELQLAPWAIDQVRTWGGVVEHPANSSLWKYYNLPHPTIKEDTYYGFTLDIDQFWFGHKAKKKTWLYVCGINRVNIPAVPMRLDLITHVIKTSKYKTTSYKQSTKKERDATPPDLAYWLVNLARLTEKP